MTRLNYAFSNLCGTVYRQGNLVFSPDGSTLYSAVGNRVASFDLIRSKCFTFPFEARRNISRLALSPDGTILLTIDDEGHLLMINVPRRVAIHHLNLKQKAADVRFSPDGKWVAFALGRLTQVWATPALERSFVPFALHDTFGGHGDDVTTLEWSADSLFIASGSKDTGVRVHPLHRIPGLQPCNLTGHRSAVRGVFFADASAESIYVVTKEGALSIWGLRERPDADAKEVAKAQAVAVAAGGAGRGERAMGQWWELIERHYLSKGGGCRVASVVYLAATKMLVVGFAQGHFSLYEMPGVSEVHSLSISESRVDAAAIAPTGDWLAFGCAQLGQLLVWEWQSESYVLKQQGHYFAEVESLAYSPGGGVIATGGGDGKVKLWSPSSGFCIVTFSEHTAPVSGVCFLPHGRALVSSSLDGTVRAFDTMRYRNFQTFVSPTPAQFTCVAVDPSGELVVAGSRDTLLVYVWNMQTAQLLDSLSGHQGPISCLAFSGGVSGTAFLASGSWDKTVRVWDFVTAKASIDVLQHGADVLDVAFSPDGSTLATSTLDGAISLWDAKEAEQIATIDGRRDITGGRSSISQVTRKNASGGKCFRSLAFSADGACLLAGGRSKYVCLYDVAERTLLRKFVLSQNVALDGVRTQLNSSKLTDAGPEEDLLLDEDSDEPNAAPPGSRQVLRRSERVTKLAVRAACVRFSPDGRSWAAASTEGLLLYGLDESLHFDPSGLELSTTPATILAAVEAGAFSRALPMALCLNEEHLLRATWQRVPPAEVPLVARELPPPYLERMLRFLAAELGASRHLHAVLLWAHQIMLSHAARLRDAPSLYEVPLRALHKGARLRYDELSRLCNSNLFSLDFVIDQLQLQEAGAAAAAAAPPPLQIAAPTFELGGAKAAASDGAVVTNGGASSGRGAKSSKRLRDK